VSPYRVVGAKDWKGFCGYVRQKGRLHITVVRMLHLLITCICGTVLRCQGGCAKGPGGLEGGRELQPRGAFAAAFVAARASRRLWGRGGAAREGGGRSH
jgi:hypothetical protein